MIAAVMANVAKVSRAQHAPGPFLRALLGANHWGRMEPALARLGRM